MAAFCHRCGVRLQPEVQFCPECDAAISVTESTPVTLVTDGPQRLIRDKRIYRQIKYWMKVLWPFAIGVPLLIWFLLPGAPENSATQSAAPSTAPEKPVPPLDYSKPIYTTENTVVCETAKLTTNKAGDAMVKAMAFHDKDAEDVAGCTEWPAGVRVAATPDPGPDSFVVFSDWGAPGSKYYASPEQLTNDPKGVPRSADSSENKTFDTSKAYINTAPTSPIPPSNSASPSIGSLSVAEPYRWSILKGDVRAAANSQGFGAVICPDSKTYAAYVNAIVSNSDEANKKTTSDYETMRRFGCSYFPPGTPMVSEGGNPAGSLAVVTVSLPDGRTIKGVMSPNEIEQVVEPGSPTIEAEKKRTTPRE
jgi:hypothetical protein